MHRYLSYDDGKTEFEAYLALPCSKETRSQGLLIAPTWAGRNSDAMRRADAFAAKGYASMVLDPYGQGRVGADRSQCAEMMSELMNDRELLFRRMQRALEVMKLQEEVDAERIAAVGYCFGGLCVLDLARGGAILRGVASLHGLFSAPDLPYSGPITAKIMVLHGFEDPMATPDEGTLLGQELTRRGADFQIHYYGSTQHAFTNPDANDPSFGTVFNARSDARSNRLLQDFLNEVLE